LLCSHSSKRVKNSRDKLILIIIAENQ
jgi:hypothetical protein